MHTIIGFNANPYSNPYGRAKDYTKGTGAYGQEKTEKSQRPKGGFASKPNPYPPMRRPEA